MERRHDRGRGEEHGRQAHPQRAGFVHVQDVEASVAHGAVHAQQDSRIDADVGARAVRGKRNSRAHGDEALGRLLPPAVHGAPGRRENAHGGDDPRLVTACLELGGQILDVVVDAARHGPRVGRHEPDAHAAAAFQSSRSSQKRRQSTAGEEGHPAPGDPLRRVANRIVMSTSGPRARAGLRWSARLIKGNETAVTATVWGLRWRAKPPRSSALPIAMVPGSMAYMAPRAEAAPRPLTTAMWPSMVLIPMAATAPWPAPVRRAAEAGTYALPASRASTAAPDFQPTLRATLDEPGLPSPISSRDSPVSSRVSSRPLGTQPAAKAPPIHSSVRPAPQRRRSRGTTRPPQAERNGAGRT